MLKVVHNTGGLYSKGEIKNKPCPPILGPTTTSHYRVSVDDRPEPPRRRRRESKPPYHVPSMAEIAALPWNGLNVVSTFSGCGGSCLGYRMAGYRILWANEFSPAAQDSYRANMSPGTILDDRDIRQVRPEEILEAIHLKPGELDLFDGSPPCQAFSTVGTRQKGWGKEKVYDHGARQCNETLFDEYIRLLRGLQPRTFIAENVWGLVLGVSKGWFLEILPALKACGYRVVARLLDAQWLGVPQRRHRIIFMGVREDLGMDPVHPLPLKYRYSLSEALENLIDDAPPVPLKGPIWDEWPRLKLGGQSKKHFDLIRPQPAEPCPPVMATGGRPGIASITHPYECRKFAIAELKRICAYPDDFILTGKYTQQWAQLGNSVPPLMMKAVAETVRDRILTS